MNHENHPEHGEIRESKTSSDFRTLPPAVIKRSERIALTSLILGIMGVVLCSCAFGSFWIFKNLMLFWIMSFVAEAFGIVAIVCAILNRLQMNQFFKTSVAGLVLGVIAIVLLVITSFSIFFTFKDDTLDTDTQEYNDTTDTPEHETTGSDENKPNHTASEHTWDSGRVTTPATNEAAGEMIYTCICGATKTEEIPVIEHTYADIWTYDDTHHWHAATCEHSDLKQNYEEHAWDEGTTIDATCENAGSVTYTCSCGATKTEEIPATKHTYADTWTYDDTHHWHAATCEHSDLKQNYEEHAWDDGTTIDATCENAGSVTYICTCGATKTEEIPKSDEHSWGEGVVTSPATCVAPGEMIYTCSGCGTTKVEEIAILDHTYADTWTYDDTHHWYAATCEHSDLKKDNAEHIWDSVKITTPTTCEAAGEMTYICICGATRVEEITKLDHTYADTWTYDDTHHWHAATCEHSDLKKDNAEHVWDSGKVTTPATCGAVGEMTYTCSCGATRVEEIAKLDHTYATTWSYDDTHHWHAATCEHSDLTQDYAEHAWDSGKVTTPTTCEAAGEMTYTCSCGATRVEEIAKLDHTYADTWTYDDTHHWHAATCEHSDLKKDNAEHVWDSGKITTPTTCEAPGEMTYTCSCGATRVEEITKLDHTYATTWTYDDTHHWHAATCEHSDLKKDKAEHVWDSGKITVSPTFESSGEMTYTCSCGATKTEVIPATSHTFADTWTYDDTHHWHAATCEHTDLKQDYVEHTWVESKPPIPATCESTGEMTFACFCGATRVEEIAKLDHTYATTWSYDDTHHWHVATCEHSDLKKDNAEHVWDSGKITTPTTCGAAGEMTYTCSCGATRVEEIAKLDHTYATTWSYDDTHHWHAATCEHSDLKQDYEEHVWDDGVVIEATCENTGSITYTCSCGATRVEEIAILDHTYSTTWSYDATYHWHAATCEHSDLTQDYAEHAWDSGKVTTPTTCGAAGEMTYTCSCGATRVEEIAKLDHTYSTVWSYDDTYHWHAATCEHSDLTQDYAEHAWDSGKVTTPATCGAAGEMTYTCSCGATRVEEIAKLDHTYATAWSYDDTHHWHAAICEHSDLSKDKAEHVWDSGKITTPTTCEAAGEMTYTCSCGATRVEEIAKLDHTYATTWTYDDTHHWHAATCEHSDLTQDYAEHAWDSGKVTTPATCGAAGEMTYTCSCGATRVEEIAKLDHTYATTWSYDATYHWHAATCEHSDLSKDKAEHVWDSGKITTPTTCEAPGEMTYTCSCGATRVEEIAKLDHTYATAWTYDDTHHWHAATCEHSDLKQSYATHAADTTGACTTCQKQLYTVGLEYAITDDGASYYVAGIGTATDTDIVIPETYNGKAVTSIGSNAFKDCTSITSVTIGNNTTSIGMFAFSGCTGMTSITIPNSMTSIGEEAFAGCTSLTGITIPSSVTSLGEIVFVGCTNLADITVDSANAVYHSDGNCLIETASKTLVVGCKNSVIPTDGSVTSIGIGAFAYCTSLESITIPDTVTDIGGLAFAYCENLTDIKLGHGVKNIDMFAFAYCTSLKNVTISNRVTSIGWCAFSNCTSLESIAISGSVTSISSEAFCGCTSLTSITVDPANSVYHSSGNCLIETESKMLVAGCQSSVIPTDGSVTRIGDSAFRDCTSLVEITIPNSVTSISKSAFSGCTGIIQTETGVSYVDKWVIDCDTSVTDVTLRANTVGIGDSAFSGFTELTSITMPDSVANIGRFAFENCTSLTSITIPDSVTSIDNYVFSNCTSLTDITIGNGVKSIGYSAFSDCTNLSNIYYIGTPAEWSAVTIDTFNDPLTVATVYYYSETAPIDATYRYWHYVDGVPTLWDVPTVTPSTYFTFELLDDDTYSIKAKDINNMPSVVMIPETYNGKAVTSIGYAAFKGCTAITGVKIPDSVTNLDNSAFENCTSLTSITIPDSVTSIGHYAFQNCSGLQNVTIGKGMTSISAFQFAHCTNLTSITIPGHITDIGFSAFTGCTELESITIPNGLTSIGQSAFDGCTKLSGIVIPDSVTSIGDYAFSGCSALPSTTYDNAEYLGNASNPYLVLLSVTDTSVTSCAIHSNTKFIHSNAFENCTGLTQITIPNSVIGVGSSAFTGCSALSSTTYDNAKYIGNASNPYLVLLEAIDTSIPSCTIHSNTKFIHSYAFQNCTELAGITIPDNVTSIGNHAFAYCTRLTEITIPNSVTSIGQSAFSGCTGLTSATISEGVQTLFYYTFQNCTSLTSVTLPSSITSIEGSAFLDCLKIARVYYAGTAAEWREVFIGSKNTYLTSGTIYYYSATEPTTGNYWHYVDGIPTAWNVDSTVSESSPYLYSENFNGTSSPINFGSGADVVSLTSGALKIDLDTYDEETGEDLEAVKAIDQNLKISTLPAFEPTEGVTDYYFEADYFIPEGAVFKLQSQFYQVTSDQGTFSWVSLYTIKADGTTATFEYQGEGAKTSNAEVYSDKLPMGEWFTLTNRINLETGMVYHYVNGVEYSHWQLTRSGNDLTNVTVKAGNSGWIIAKPNKPWGSGMKYSTTPGLTSYALGHCAQYPEGYKGYIMLDNLNIYTDPVLFTEKDYAAVDETYNLRTISPR